MPLGILAFISFMNFNVSKTAEPFEFSAARSVLNEYYAKVADAKKDRAGQTLDRLMGE